MRDDGPGLWPSVRLGLGLYSELCEKDCTVRDDRARVVARCPSRVFTLSCVRRTAQ